MKKSVIFLSILISVNLSAQKQDYQWLFGYNSPFATPTGGCVLDFNHEPPIAYQQDRDLNLDVTVGSMCDEDGQILFYTNGINIHNHANLLMENGDSLNPGTLANNWFEGGYRAYQSVLSLRNSSNPNIFHSFHLKADYDNTVGIARTTLYSTNINMSFNSGLGKVISKNEEILTNQNLVTITAVKHGNGRDWWIYINHLGINKYFKILFLNNQIETIEEIVLDPEFAPLLSDGSIAFSADGSKLARYEIQHGAYIYDFDRCSGEFSNPIFIKLEDTNWGGGVSFSPSNQFLYLTSTVEVYQFDLWSDDIEASIDTVAIYDGYESPVSTPTSFFISQLGPDGRIYINTTSNADVLHVINYPDKKGSDCQFKQHGVQLPTRNLLTSQHFPNYRLGPLDGSPCDTLGLDNHPLAGFRYESDSLNTFLVEFTDNSFYEPTDWLWDFDDDGATSTEKNPLHEFSGSGVYEVCLTVSNQYDSDTFCREVEIILNDAREVEMQDFEVSIAPNPVREEFTVFTSAYLQKAANLLVFNQLGQEVARFDLQKGQQVHNFILKNVARGIYFYAIFQENIKVNEGKIVVAK